MAIGMGMEMGMGMAMGTGTEMGIIINSHMSGRHDVRMQCIGPDI